MKKAFRNIICATLVVIAAGCAPKALTEETLFYTADDATIADLTKDGKLYTLNEFKDQFMTEEGNYLSKTSPYRNRSRVDANTYLFTIDTLPENGEGIYIMGRIATDEMGGNFYKSPVIQQMVNGEQQTLRLSVDMGSFSGMYQIGQVILIRCNGFAVGRYANEPQLCVPSYNNNTNAMSASDKVGWAAGRIPGPRFCAATKKIGVPDRNLLHYDTLTLEEFTNTYMANPTDIKGNRKFDSHLVYLKGVHFTGQYENNATLSNCTFYNPIKGGNDGDPEHDQNVNVFAPTTTNIGFPPSRIIADSLGMYDLLVGNSEYAKFARYYLPCEIRGNFQEFNYERAQGDIEGIVGYYLDNAGKCSSDTYLTRYKFSITPRDLNDLHFHINAFDAEGNFVHSEPWIPVEFAKSNYIKTAWQ